jgi:hypothetical protein
MGFFTSAANSSAAASAPAPQAAHWSNDQRIIEALFNSVGLFPSLEAVLCFMQCCKSEPTEAYKQFAKGFNTSGDIVARTVDMLTAIKEVLEDMATTVDDAMTSAEHEKAADEFAAATAHKSDLALALEQAIAAAADAAAAVLAVRSDASALCSRFTAGQAVPAMELQTAAEAITAAEARKAKADECVASSKSALDTFVMPPPPAEQDFPEWAQAANFVDSMSCVPNTLEFTAATADFIESAKLEALLKYAGETLSVSTIAADVELKQELTAANRVLTERVLADCESCLVRKDMRQFSSVNKRINSIIEWGRRVGDESRNPKLHEMKTKLNLMREVAAFKSRKAEIMSQ